MPITTTATVRTIRNESPSVYSLIVKPDARISFEPGQFFFINLERDDGKIAKAYSAASMPDEEFIEFCIKRVENGFASNTLYSLKNGDKIGIKGPYGAFKLQDTTRPTFFLATGTGVTPFRPMIKTLLKKNAKHDIWLIFGVRTQKDILYRKEFEELAEKNKSFHFIPVLSTEQWEGEKGHIQDVIWKHAKNIDADYYICGLHIMVDQMRALLLERGVEKERIHLERYT